MTGVKIEIKLPKNRNEVGTLTIQRDDGRVLLSDIPALGKADRDAANKHENNSRDPLRRYGHTPTGRYGVTKILSTGDGTPYDVNKYGPHGAIVLEPVEGQALAAKLNGRTGLFIHSGRDHGNGRLVPTNGCIRVSNDDMKRIVDAVVGASQNAAQNRCEMITIEVGIAEGGEEEGYDEGDPPPQKSEAPVIFP